MNSNSAVSRPYADMPLPDESGWRVVGRRVAVAVLVLAVAGLLVMAGLSYSRQVAEDRVVEQYLADNGLIGAPPTWQTALAVLATVERDFVTDKDQWRHFSIADRPFFRHDTKWLLEKREGVCGQGARVMVNLLQALGFDATRITIYRTGLTPSHTFESVIIDGEEYFVDSINSPEYVGDLFASRRISPDDLFIRSYTTNAVDRAERRAEAFDIVREIHNSTDPYDVFRRRIEAYSYEALPLTRLAIAAGLDWRIINLSRPPVWVSALAEKPNLLMSFLYLGAAIAVAAFGALTWWLTGRVVRKVSARETARASRSGRSTAPLGG